MPPNCLIAAHDPWMTQLLRVYAEECGFTVFQVFDGQDVLPTIRRDHPQVVLIELELPGQIDGQALMLALRSDQELKHIPVLLYSWHTPGLVIDLTDDTTTYLQEPVTYEDFVTALKKVGVYASARSL